ncbi:MAG: uroporphyrinogen-III synthase [Beijerinckiaceae bacterium]
MTTVLVARPERDARATAERLTARGYTAIVTPVLAIQPLAAALPAGVFDAAIVTSGHAIPFLTDRWSEGQSKPVFAVGDRTARALQAAGFKDVRNASGDRLALGALVRKSLPKGARILAPVGRDHHEDLPASLSEDGFSVTPLAVYAASIAEALSPDALAALRYDVADAVLHYSPRSASGFVELLRRTEIDPSRLKLQHICLSQAVADALPQALQARTTIAAHPDEDAVMAALDSHFGQGEGEAHKGTAKSRKGRTRALPVDVTPQKISATASAPFAAPVEAAPKAEAEAEISPPTISGAIPAASLTVPSEAKSKPADVAGPVAFAPDPAPATAYEQQSSAPLRLDRELSGEPPVFRKEGTEAGPVAAGAPVAPAAPRRRGVWGLLGAGVIGGLIGGTVALFLPPYLPAGWIPQKAGPDIPALVAAQVKAQMDTRLATVVSRSDLDPVRQEVAAVASAAAKPLQEIEALRKIADALSQRIAESERLIRVTPDMVSATQRQVGDLVRRVDLLDGVAKVPYDIVALQKRLDEIAARKVDSPEIEPVQRKAVANEAAVADLRSQLSESQGQVAAATRALAELRTKLASLENRPLPDTSRPVRTHALATALAAAFQRGAPYRAELDAMQTAGGDPALLTPLAAYADKGAPGGAALGRDFAAVLPAVLKAIAPPADDTSVIGRLRAMVGGAIKVRPVGSSADASPAGLVARIEAALPRGQIADALTAWQALPDGVKTASAAFGAALKSRVEAEAATRKLVEQATQALARP